MTISATPGMIVERKAIRSAKLLYEISAGSPIDQSLRFGNASGKATLGSTGTREGIAAFVEGPARPTDALPEGTTR